MAISLPLLISILAVASIPDLSPSQQAVVETGVLDASSHDEPAFGALIDHVRLWPEETAASRSFDLSLLQDQAGVIGPIAGSLVGELIESEALDEPWVGVERCIVTVEQTPIIVYAIDAPDIDDGAMIRVDARHYKPMELVGRNTGETHTYIALVGRIRPAEASAGASSSSSSSTLRLVPAIIVMFGGVLILRKLAGSKKPAAHAGHDWGADERVDTPSDLPEDPAAALESLDPRNRP